MRKVSKELEDEAVRHLQALLRFDTTNPPGNEIAVARYVKEVLEKDGIEARIFEPFPGRGNVVARLPKTLSLGGVGAGDGGGPLVLCSHMDVVPAERDKWRRDPFSGEIAEGCIWGRGAVDMKSLLALSLACVSDLKRRKVDLRRDVVLVGVADEEMGSEKGARWLVAHEPEAIAGEWGLGEVGGFTLHIGGKRAYPVQRAERGIAWIRVVADGPPGHGSMPHNENAVLRLARAVSLFRSNALPIHVTEPARAFLDSLSFFVGGAWGRALRLLENPWFSDFLLDRMPPEKRRGLNPLLRNTVSPTILEAGSKENVIPSRAYAVLDGRILPGYTTADLLAELRGLLGSDAEGIRFEVLREAPPNVVPRKTPLFELISSVVREHDPGAEAVPYLISGFTDAQPLAALGIKQYGFNPVKLPEGLDFGALYHGHDERIPEDGFRWGVSVLADLLDRFCVAPTASR
jgi:acetylornithine deacetylase/succinyl-diaminopimelate desuccinylase-like protein